MGFLDVFLFVCLTIIITGKFINNIIARVRRVGFFNFGSGSDIEKIFWVGSGIGYLYQIPSQSGNEILIGYRPSILYFLYFLIFNILFD